MAFSSTLSADSPTVWGGVTPLCPGECPDDCKEGVIQQPRVTPPFQSSQLSSGRLCRSGCRCRSMTFGVAIKKAKFRKFWDIVCKKTRQRHQEKDAIIMTHRLLKFLAPNDLNDVVCVCQAHSFKAVCRADCSHPRQCVGRWICCRSVKPRRSLPSLFKQHRERRDVRVGHVVAELPLQDL